MINNEIDVVDNFKDEPFFYWEYVIVWLNNFSKQYSYFSNGKWLQMHPDLRNWDQKYIVKMNLFFDKIQDYAKNNYLLPSKHDDEEIYHIQWNHVNYQIGHNKDNEYFCKRLNKKIDNCISYEDILGGKKDDRALLFDYKLDILSQLVHSYLIDGIPCDAICDIVHRTIDEHHHRGSNCHYGRVKKR